MDSHTYDNSQSLFESIKNAQVSSADTEGEMHPILLGRRLPPVEKWHPTRISPFNILITDNGEWWHDGALITRQALVDVFSSVLWTDIDDDERRHYYLKTPSDMYEIGVADVPLFITTVERVVVEEQEIIVFGTRHGDKVALSLDNHLYFKNFITDEGVVQERLYIDMQHGLPARIERSVLYHLVQMGELSDVDGRITLTLMSGGHTFVLTSQALADD